jgi:beta-lactamase class A
MLNVALWMAAAAACAPGTLRQEIGRIAGSAGGTVGAAVVLLETGERVELNGARPFPMQSVYKLPIAMAVLKEIDGGRLRLDQRVRVEKADLTPPVVSPLREKLPECGVELPVRELLRAMIVQSDGLACDLLLKLAPPAEVTRFLRSLGVADMTVATTEKAMALDGKAQYRNHATPEAAVALLSLLQEGRGLSAASREMLLADLTAAETGPRRLKGRLPEGTPVAHKTGTSGTFRGLTRATNDIGIITLPDGRHLAVAVFVMDSRARESAREGAIAAIARAAWDCWTTGTLKP